MKLQPSEDTSMSEPLNPAAAPASIPIAPASIPSAVPASPVPRPASRPHSTPRSVSTLSADSGMRQVMQESDGKAATASRPSSVRVTPLTPLLPPPQPAADLASSPEASASRTSHNADVTTPVIDTSSPEDKSASLSKADNSKQEQKTDEPKEEPADKSPPPKVAQEDNKEHDIFSASAASSTTNSKTKSEKSGTRQDSTADAVAAAVLAAKAAESSRSRRSSTSSSSSSATSKQAEPVAITEEFIIPEAKQDAPSVASIDSLSGAKSAAKGDDLPQPRGNDQDDVNTAASNDSPPIAESEKDSRKDAESVDKRSGQSSGRDNDAASSKSI